MALTKAEILTARTQNVVKVNCPEWGGDVCLRPITGTQRDEIEDRSRKEQWRGLRATLVAYSLCSEDGKPLGFTADEITQLGEQSAVVLDRLFGIAQRLSGFTAEAVQELEGNSAAAQSGDSG